MACGTPVIAFNRGSVPEIVEDGLTGFIVEDELGAIGAVQRLSEINRDGVRKRFDERFTARRMAQDYLEVYRSLHDTSAAPRLRVVSGDEAAHVRTGRQRGALMRHPPCRERSPAEAQRRRAGVEVTQPDACASATPPAARFASIADAWHRRSFSNERRPQAAYALPLQGRVKGPPAASPASAPRCRRARRPRWRRAPGTRCCCRSGR